MKEEKPSWQLVKNEEREIERRGKWEKGKRR